MMSNEYIKQAKTLRRELASWFNIPMPTVKDEEIFETLVAAALRNAAEDALKQEREECAKIAIGKGIGNGHLETCGWIAAAIRARSDAPKG